MLQNSKRTLAVTYDVACGIQSRTSDFQRLVCHALNSDILWEVELIIPVFCLLGFI